MANAQVCALATSNANLEVDQQNLTQGVRWLIEERLVLYKCINAADSEVKAKQQHTTAALEVTHELWQNSMHLMNAQGSFVGQVGAAAKVLG